MRNISVKLHAVFMAWGCFFCVLYHIFGGITNIIGGGMKGRDGLVFYFRESTFSEL